MYLIYTHFSQFYTYMHKPVATVVSNELLSGLIIQREKKGHGISLSRREGGVGSGAYRVFHYVVPYCSSIASLW